MKFLNVSQNNFELEANSVNTYVRVDIYQKLRKKERKKKKNQAICRNTSECKLGAVTELRKFFCGTYGLFVLLNKLLKVRSTRKPFQVSKHTMSDLPEMVLDAVM